MIPLFKCTAIYYIHMSPYYDNDLLLRKMNVITVYHLIWEYGII